MLNKEQNDKFKRLINSVCTKVPFYQEYQNLNARDCDSNYIYEKMPIIDKYIIKNQYSKFISNDVDNHILEIIKKNYLHNIDDLKYKNWTVEYTSGTTGVPFFSIKSDIERITLGRIIWKHRKMIGINNPENMFLFMHTNSSKLDFFEKKSLEEQISILSNEKITSWHINPYLLDIYAKYILNNNVRFSNLKYIEINGSFTSENDKNYYEKVFKCKIVNNYGCREVWTIAYDNEQGELCEVSEGIYLEVIDKKGKIINDSDTEGDIIVTSLVQSTMPIIKYKIGDRGKISYNNRGEKIIHIIPNRSTIVGTNYNGNETYRKVIIFMNQLFGMFDFYSINIEQTKMFNFNVYIYKCQEEKNKFVSAFEYCSKLILGFDFIYNYIFSDVNFKTKSLFSISKDYIN